MQNTFFNNSEAKNTIQNPIWPDGTPGQLDLDTQDVALMRRCAHEPSFVPYFIESDRVRPCLIILPGGGYFGRAYHEGEPIAEWANALGWHAIVVHYRLSPYQDPWPLTDAQRVIRLLRFNANKWNIDSTRIGVCGFSAGGHLAASCATRWTGPHVDSDDPIEHLDDRPDCVILCYAVIASKYGHTGSFTNLLGQDPDEAALARTDAQAMVNAQTPPAFIWHTAEDEVVPVANAYGFATACAKHKVEHACHVFPHGVHGIGLADEVPMANTWSELCGRWLKESCGW